MTNAPERIDERPGSTEPGAARPRLQGYVCIGVAVLLTALKVWLVRGQTLAALAPAPADDELFIIIAKAVAEGRWLGTLNDLTLAKGPVYPLFLALNHLAGTPLLVSQAVVYAVASGIVAWAFRPVLPAPWRLTVLFVALLFNPVTWADGPSTRVIREGLYSSETLLALGLAAGAALRLVNGSRTALAWAFSAGVAGALVALTREEGVWLVPSIALVALGATVVIRRSGWRRLLAAIAVAVVGYAGPVTAVATLNWRHYGLFVTNETRADFFLAAAGALTRVTVPDSNLRVPVPRAARKALYEVSPALREIAPFLEDSVAGWAGHSCKSMGICDDIAGGWFNWAFREAVMRAGKYRDGATAAAWYRQVAREVDAACLSGTLRCSPPRSDLLPPLRAAYFGPIARAFGRAAVLLAAMREITARPTSPNANSAERAAIQRFTHEQIPRPLIDLEGTVASTAGEVYAAVVDGKARPVAATILRRPVGGTAAARPDATSSTRVEVETDCVVDCALALFTAERRTTMVELADGSVSSADPALAWTAGTLRRRSEPPTGPEARGGRLETLAGVTAAYGIGTPLAFAIAIAVLLWRLRTVFRTREVLVPAVIGLALLAAVVVRLVLVALLDVFLFPSVTVLYLAPAYGPLICFSAFVLVVRWRRLQPDPGDA